MKRNLFVASAGGGFKIRRRRRDAAATAATAVAVVVVVVRSNAMPCYLVTRWNYIGFFLVARPVCRNRTGIRDDSMPDIFSAAEPGRNAASRRHPVITTRPGRFNSTVDFRLFFFFDSASFSALDKLHLTLPLIRTPKKCA